MSLECEGGGQYIHISENHSAHALKVPNRVFFLNFFTIFFFQKRKLPQSARQIVMSVRRETHEQPTPQRNASASQPTTNNKTPTTTTATDTNTTTTATINNQQQMHRNKKNNNTSHASQNAPSPASMPALAHRKSRALQQSQLKRKTTSRGIQQHGKSVATSGYSGSGVPAFFFQNSETDAGHAETEMVHQSEQHGRRQ